MNLIRLIKLKKINGELENLTEQEKYVLYIFDTLVKNGNTYYGVVFGYELTVFQFSHRYKNVYCSHKVCNEIANKFHISPNKVIKLILGTFKKIGLGGYKFIYIMDIMS